jgi:hypothetical protein
MARLMRVISILILLLFSIPVVAAAGDSSSLEVIPDSAGSFLGTAPFDPLQGSHKQTWDAKTWSDYAYGMEQMWKEKQWKQMEPDNSQMKTINDWKIKAFQMSLKKLKDDKKTVPTHPDGWDEAQIEIDMAKAQTSNGYNQDALDSINKAETVSKAHYNHGMTLQSLYTKKDILTKMGRTSEAATVQAEASKLNEQIQSRGQTSSSSDSDLPLSPLVPIIGILCAVYILSRRTIR